MMGSGSGRRSSKSKHQFRNQRRGTRSSPRTQRSDEPQNAASSTSDIEMNSPQPARRTSARLSKKGPEARSCPEELKIKPTPTAQMRDSAYDADAESGTAESSPEKSCCDPYEFNMIEDVPLVSKKHKQNSRKGKQKSKPTRKAKQKSVPTSTPVLSSPEERNHARYKKKRRGPPNLTPEVTPILPVNVEDASSGQTDCSKKVTRKRKACSSPETPSLPCPILHNSSMADSGVVLSPTPKRNIQNIDKSGLQLVSKLKRRAPCLPLSCNKSENIMSDAPQELKSSKRRKPLAQTTINAQDSAVSSPPSKPFNDSCFGFSSISSPFTSYNTPCSDTKPARKDLVSPPSYRSTSGIISDSSGDSSPIPSSTKEQGDQRGGSPVLFSDAFSTDADSMDINRSSTKMYKISHARKTKDKVSKPSLSSSKLDGWASKFNMEIEDIEKFDLIIE